jgi:hypothetical protein
MHSPMDTCSMQASAVAAVACLVLAIAMATQMLAFECGKPEGCGQSVPGDILC